MKTKLFVSLLVSLMLASAGCEKQKDAEPPELTFKEGPGYISSNSNVGPNNQVTFGVIGRKNKAALTTFIIYQAYDNFSYQQIYLYTLNSNEKETFSHDYQITTRSESGTERYKFTLTDADGNTAVREIFLKVQ
jgi:hypothetical protein